MSRFEADFLASMAAVDAAIARTEDPHHRAILENYRRHVYLEVSGRIDEILSPEMTVEHPHYRISWAGQVRVLDGTREVRAFYTELGHAGAVLWNTEESVAVADWGFAAELTLHQLLPGAALAADGEEVDDQEATYHLSSRQAFVWPYDERARLRGEHIYEDVSTRRFEKVAPADVITPERAAELFAPHLA
ncbi:MAG: hypothetical protein QM729_08510 [Solirubrobacterales bacterium]